MVNFATIESPEFELCSLQFADISNLMSSFADTFCLQKLETSASFLAEISVRSP